MADATVGFLFRCGDFSVHELHTSNGVANRVDRFTQPHPIPWAGIFSGHYKLQGSCTLNGDPVGNRRVFAMPHLMGFTVAGAAVGPDGLFLFDGLSPGKYKIIGEDADGTTNGAIFAYVDAVPR